MPCVPNATREARAYFFYRALYTEIEYSQECSNTQCMHAKMQTTATANDAKGLQATDYRLQITKWPLKRGRP
jgi:hypothetical protein